LSGNSEVVARVGVAVFGRDGRLLMHTPSFAELLDGAAGPIAAGANLSALLAPLGASDSETGLHCDTPGGRSIDIAFETLARDRCCMTVTDVTEARAARAELLRAQTVAEAANQAKSTFLATMTHELRTPLNAVIGFSDELTHRGQGLEGTPIDPAEVAEFATAINQAGQHLLDRINTILDIARIEAGRFDLASDVIDIDYMLRHALLQMRPMADAARVGLVANVPPNLPRLRADERRIRQVIAHLLSNAVKFSFEGGEVVVTVFRTAEDLQIAVRDHGIGIAPENLEKVFEPFNQLDATLSRRVPGAGLGLYAARSLVTAHGGSIHLASAPGRGATATVRLPSGRLIPHSCESTQAEDPS
jgi:signal transduction histidine kinase